MASEEEIERLCGELEAGSRSIRALILAAREQVAEIAELRQHVATVMSRESAVQAELAEAKREAAEHRHWRDEHRARASEVEQLKRLIVEERDAAADGVLHAQRERDTLRADLERVTLERDQSRTAARNWLNCPARNYTDETGQGWRTFKREEADKLEAEVRRLSEDAARLDWLEGQAVPLCTAGDGVLISLTVAYPGNTLRDGIDAVRAMEVR